MNLLLLLFLYVRIPCVRVWLTAELCACANYKSRARRQEDKLEISGTVYALKHTLYFEVDYL